MSTYTTYTSAAGHRIEMYTGTKGCAVCRIGYLNYEVQLNNCDSTFLCDSIDAMMDFIGFEKPASVCEIAV